MTAQTTTEYPPLPRHPQTGFINQDQLRQEVEMVGSLTAVATYYGVSREYIRQLVGSGHGATSQGLHLSSCIDCGRSFEGVKKSGGGRCERCGRFFSRHGITWTPEAQEAVTAARRPTHCHLGHPLTPDNVYPQKNGTRRCKLCHKLAKQRYMSQPGKKAAWNACHARYIQQRLETDPTFREQLREKCRRVNQKRKERRQAEKRRADQGGA